MLPAGVGTCGQLAIAHGAAGDDALHGFQRWLSKQPQHDAVNNYAWWPLVLREVFDHGSEDALAYPGDDALVVDHLFARLREFLGGPDPHGASWA